MGYYISKKDKELLVPLIEKMRRTGEDFVIPSSSPVRLAYLIRNGLNVEPEWFDIKHKFRISVKESKVSFRIRNIQIDLAIEWIELDSPSFIELCTELFKKPEGIKVTNYIPSEVERFRLDRFCDNAGYKILTILPSTLEIKRDD